LIFIPEIFPDFFRGKTGNWIRKTGDPDLRPRFFGGLATGKSYNFGFYGFPLITIKKSPIGLSYRILFSFQFSLLKNSRIFYGENRKPDPDRTGSPNRPDHKKYFSIHQKEILVLRRIQENAN
jgi:hypothetical protein